MMKKVDFFLIGAPRSATTTIAENLSKLDSVYIPAEKEPHFFCFDFHREGYKFHKRRTFFRHLSWQSYERIYKNARQDQILGDCSTSYIYSEEAARQIYNYNPEAKIIAIIREPVSLMYSWYKYLKYYNEEDAETFSRALNLEKERAKGKNIPPLVKFPSRLQYSKVADYNKNLGRYLKIFPKKNLLFILFDDFVVDPVKTLNQILCFVGSPDKIKKAIIGRNQQRDFRFCSIKKYVDLFMVKSSRLRIVPKFITKPFSSIYHSIFDIAGKRQKLDNDTLQLLKNEYRNKVVRLSKIIKKKLVKIWGY